MRKKELSGELTVFVAMILMMVASVLFTMLEGARYKCLQSIAAMDSLLETESMLAEYNRPLLEEYGLFFLDDSYGSGQEDMEKVRERILNLASENQTPDVVSGGESLLTVALKEVDFAEVDLATDGEGSIFRQQVVDYVKRNAVLEGWQELEGIITGMSSGEDTTNYNAGTVSDAKEAVVEAHVEAQNNEDETGTQQVPDIEFENPIEFFEMLNGGLAVHMAIPQGQTVSGTTVDLTATTMNEIRYEGTGNSYSSPGATEKAIYLWYLHNYFGNFVNPKEGTTLQYELEFIYGGKNSDVENLQLVVARLMEIRGASNLLYLHTDVEKQSLATEIATALAGASFNPALIFAVREGILFIWAYAESIADVRTLLAGGKVPVVKSATTWTTDLTHLLSGYNQNQQATQSESGFTYEQYLLFLLYLQDPTVQNYRTMTAMELNIRAMEHYENFRMDTMIQSGILDYTYEATPIFLSLVTLGDLGELEYVYREERKYTYLST